MNAHDMVQHSFWHQRIQFNRSEPVCPICHNPVQFSLGDGLGRGVGWLCHLGHPINTPVYESLPQISCPFNALHTTATL